jgi:hypothetical protein
MEMIAKIGVIGAGRKIYVHTRSMSTWSVLDLKRAIIILIPVVPIPTLGAMIIYSK